MKGNTLKQSYKEQQLAANQKELARMYSEAADKDSRREAIHQRILAEIQRINALPKGDKGDKGDQGNPGKDGKDGKDGETPIRGKHYFTSADIETLSQYIIKKIKLPEDGKDAVVDHSALAKEIVEKIVKENVIEVEHIKGLRSEIDSYRNQLALKQAGQHGGGDTVSAGSGISITNVNGTKQISATGSGSGTVTDVSVVSANGFAGSVADSTTTPAITLETTVTGILIGDGTGVAAATPNTDYQSPITLTTTGSSGAATFDGTTLNIPQYTGGSGGQVDEVVGTTNRIDVDATDPTAPIVDIAATYVGQTSITTVGTIATGTWSGSFGAVSGANLTNLTAANISAGTAGINITGNAATLTVANEATDTTCFIGFYTAASGSLPGKTNTNMTFNSNTGVATFASTVLTTTDINGGTIDGVTIGGSSAGAITGTTVTANTGFMPDANDGAYLGQSGTAFSDLFLASGAVIDFAAGNAVITHSSGILTVSTGDLRVTTAGTNAASVATLQGTQTLTNKTISVDDNTVSGIAASSFVLSNGSGNIDGSASQKAIPSGVVVGTTDTQTLTNKRVTRRLTTTNAPGATPTTNSDNVDIMNFTGLSTAITSMTTNLSGTPVDGDLLEFRFTDNGTARAITWGASFSATTVALPTTTVISTMLRVLFEYNGSTWACIATA